MKEKYKVKRIENFIAKEWLIKKHYAKRMCSISFAFGIFNIDNVINGVCTFGYPPNKSYNNGDCVFNNYWGYKKYTKER